MFRDSGGALPGRCARFLSWAAQDTENGDEPRLPRGKAWHCVQATELQKLHLLLLFLMMKNQRSRLSLEALSTAAQDGIGV
jgi:hypothetical protein